MTAKDAIKRGLVKLGYHNKCSQCSHESFSYNRFIMDVFFITSFLLIAFLYFTQELPALKASYNCTIQQFIYNNRTRSFIPNLNMSVIGVPEGLMNPISSE